MEYLNFIVTLQISFLFYILFFNNNLLNKILGVIFLIPVINFSFNILDISNSYTAVFGILFFPVKATAYLFAPLIFYYLRRVCGKKITLNHYLFIITVVIICCGLFFFIKYLAMDGVSRENYVHAIKSEDYPFEIIVFKSLLALMNLVYFTIAVYEVCKFKKKFTNIFSAKSKVKVDFVERFAIIMWGTNIIIIIAYLVLPTYLAEFLIIPFTMFFVNSFIIYYVFKHQSVLSESSYQIFQKDLKPVTHTNIDVIFIKDKDDRELKAKAVLDYLIDNKSYLKSEYTIFDLSKELHFSHTEISSIINSELNKNFCKLINDLRVEESKSILKEKSSYLTIEAIAELSGFNSRASFYRAFKKTTGITPSIFINS